MKNLYFIIFFNLFSFNAYSQTQAIKNTTDFKEINALIDSARLYVANKPSQAIIFGEKALELCKKNNYYEGQTTTLKLLASANRNLDNYSASLNYLFTALELDKKNNSELNIAITYNDIGLIYFRLNDYDKALKNYYNSLQLAEKIHNFKLLPNVYNNIGTVYQTNGEFDRAESFMTKALKIFEERKDSIGISRLLNNLGFLNETRGDNNAALQYYLKALEIKRRFNNKPDITNTLQNIASIYLNLNRPDEAIKLLNESIATAKEISNQRLLADGYLLLTFAYYFKQDTKNSLNYKNLYYKISEEIKRQDQKKKIAEIVVKTDLEQKQKQNEYLSNLTRLQQIYFTIIAIIFGLIVISLIIMYRKTRNINRQLIDSSNQTKRRVVFIENLSKFSTELINIELDKIDTKITEALQFITNFTNNKFTALYSLVEKKFSLRYCYVYPDFFFKLKEINIDKNTEKIFSPLFLDHTNSIEKNLLPEEFVELIDQNINRLHVVPIKIEGKLWGIIIIGSEYEKARLSEEEESIFKLTGDVLTNAIKRKINEERLVVYSKELEEINKSKDKFYSMVSHDLKSPFQGLLGMTSFIISEVDSLSKQEIKELVGSIENSARNLFSLLENLLNWTRFELGRIQFFPENFTLYSLISEILLLLKSIADKKQIEIKIDVKEDFMLFADRKMFYSILSNLIINGLKFTKPNGTITISAYKTLSQSIISVCDTGIGMTKEQIDNLFDITKISSSTGTNNEKGTGLGLLLVGEMVEMHKGEIEIDSTPEKGTCITISIPQ